ncbi:MAG: hypothetical protein EA388_02975 [Nitriliruptor sp.]|nr:MAG: hypothetical protein EA388_02975 [Nitriliruptor sp.]
MTRSWTSGAGRATARRGLAALFTATLATLVLAATATPALAHASLVEATPSDRSTLDDVPEQVTLQFDEPVTLPTGGLRVFDGDANRIDDGEVDVGGPETIGVGLPADLPDGGYVVTYRVLSADSHPVGGVYTFTIGEAAPVDDAVVADLFAGGGQVVGIIGSALRAIGYVAVLLATGVVFITALIVRRPEDRRRAARLSARAAVVGIAATILAVPVQAIAVTGGGLLEVLRPAVLGEVLASSFGQGTLVRLVWLIVLAVFVARGAALLPSAVAAAVALGSFLLDGHQRSVEPMWLLMGSDIVHLGAGAVWFGGLVLLVLLVRSRSIDDDAVGAARLVARFSSVALVSFIAVSLAGTAMSWALVRTPNALITTTYGWTLMAKVGLVGLVVLVALYNRQRLVPAIAARAVPAGGSIDAGDEVVAADAVVRRSRVAWQQLRTTLTIEVSLLVAVLAVTGALVTIQPAAQAAGVTGAFQTVEALTDDLDVEVTVDPNQAGLNAIHIYVLDETGRPAADVEDLYIDVTFVPEEIGPLRIEPFFAGTGHWTTNTEALAFDGEWRIEVIAGLDRFTEERAEITVFVNR